MPRGSLDPRQKKEMRRITFILLATASLLFASGIARAQYMNGYSELGDSDTVASLREHVTTISSAMMEGRKAGSEGEKMTAEYVSEILEKYGIDVLSGKEGDPFGVRQENGDTLVSRNVCGFIHGGDKSLRDRYIVIGARMDNLGTGTMTVDGQAVNKIYYGANGNASGLAMMLELARMLKMNRYQLRRSVLFVAFGASRESFAGSWYFLNRSFSDVSNIDAMINLDMLGTGSEGFYAYTSSNADMNALAATLSNELHPITPEITALEPYPSDHVAFYDKSIPSIFFTTGRYAAHDTERDTQSIIDYDSMEKELEYIFDYSIALAGGPKPIFNPSEVVKSSEEVAGVVPYYDCDIKPSFLGSTDPKVFLQKWVYTYMKYPEEAIKNGIQGRVLVDFVIDEAGKVRDVRVLKGADPLLDDEAVRIVSASPQWKPGRVRGVKVKSGISLYVEFRLEKKGTRSFGFKKN